VLRPHAVVGYMVQQDSGKAGIVMRRTARIDMVFQYQFVEDVEEGDFTIYAGQQRKNKRFQSHLFVNIICLILNAF